MKIVILGANGQLGKNLSKKLSKIYNIHIFTKLELDITDFKKVKIQLNKILPNIIINTAAFTAVDTAESKQDLAYKINSIAVGNLAKVSQQLNCWLIHFSTDYVFDGKKNSSYLETDTPNPINIYGKSKLGGEKLIVNLNHKYLIFRTSWVMGIDGYNFIKSILKLSLIKNEIQVVNDQIGVPTSTDLITKVVEKAIIAIVRGDPWEKGIYNLTPNGITTWYDMAEIIIDLAKKYEFSNQIIVDTIKPIKSSAYLSKAQRPLNSILNNNKLSNNLDFTLPDWRNDFTSCVKSILSNIKNIN